jgi:hypothetical protein
MVIVQEVTTDAIKPAIEPEIVHEESLGENPLPVIATGVVPSGPVLGVRTMLGPAWTLVRNAVSAETNRAIARTSSVTAYRMRRKVPKSSLTSLKLIDKAVIDCT